MKVIPINNKYNKNNSINFQSLIIKKSAYNVINKMTDTERQEVKNIAQRLAQTKFWDMEIKQLNNLNEFWCKFVEKKHPKNIHYTGVTPYRIEGTKVQVYSPSLVDYEDKTEELFFSSPERAQAMMNMHEKHVKNQSNRTNLNELREWEEKLNFLDEAYRFMKNGECYDEFDKAPLKQKNKQNLLDTILAKFGLQRINKL